MSPSSLPVSLRGLDALESALDLMAPDSTEEPVQQVWNGIIHHWFPLGEGFRVETKAATDPNNDNQPKHILIQVRMSRRNKDPAGYNRKWDERQILLVQCKRLSFDTPGQWEEAITGQFQDDCMAFSPSEMIFGAVAIGKKVKFFRFNGQNSSDGLEQLVALHRDTLSLTTGKGLDEVARWMDYVKANACSDGGMGPE